VGFCVKIKLMFASRREAGEKLASKLEEYKKEKAIVLAIPRGGVIIGSVIAKKLGLPLKVLITRKIGAPGNPELAIGAVGPDGLRIINWELVSQLGVENDYLSQETEKESLKIEKKQAKFGQGKLEIKNKTVILVDDGIATGSTVEVAVLWLKYNKVAKIILAVPVAPPEVIKKFKGLVDKLVILKTPYPFSAVGQFYRDFPQISDEEVIKLLSNQ